jgi:hypothetical protein
VSLTIYGEYYSVDIKAAEKWHQYWNNTHYRGKKYHSDAAWRGMKSYDHVIGKFEKLYCMKYINNCPCQYEASQHELLQRYYTNFTFALKEEWYACTGTFY